MEKRKLKLNELTVQSFVTAFDKVKGQTDEIQGGYSLFNGCTIGQYSCFGFTCAWAVSCALGGTCDITCGATCQNAPSCLGTHCNC